MFGGTICLEILKAKTNFLKLTNSIDIKHIYYFSAKFSQQNLIFRLIQKVENSSP